LCILPVDCEEARFLAAVLHVLGVEYLLQTIAVGSSDPSVIKVGDVAALKDVVDVSTIFPASYFNQFPQYSKLSLFDSK
jgi:purine nucleoside phosphorylase